MENWSTTQKIVYTTHVWVGKTKIYPQLQDFDYSSMTIIISRFICCHQPNVDFSHHIEDCFYLFRKTEFAIPEWTKEEFTKLYLECRQSDEVQSNDKSEEDMQDIEMKWKGYLTYLEDWTIEHSNAAFAGDSPPSYDDWTENQWLNNEE